MKQHLKYFYTDIKKFQKFFEKHNNASKKLFFSIILLQDNIQPCQISARNYFTKQSTKTFF